MGVALGRGTLTSIVLVLFVLPQILLVFDGVIDRTEFNRGAVKQDRETSKEPVRTEGGADNEEHN